VVAEVAGMDMTQLTASSLQVETTLAILYARAVLLKIFSSWPDDLPLDSAVMGHNHHLLQLLKVIPSASIPDVTSIFTLFENLFTRDI
jgi:hypothetical protein